MTSVYRFFRSRFFFCFIVCLLLLSSSHASWVYFFYLALARLLGDGSKMFPRMHTPPEETSGCRWTGRLGSSSTHSTHSHIYPYSIHTKLRVFHMMLKTFSIFNGMLCELSASTTEVCVCVQIPERHESQIFSHQINAGWRWENETRACSFSFTAQHTKCECALLRTSSISHVIRSLICWWFGFDSECWMWH